MLMHTKKKPDVEDQAFSIQIHTVRIKMNTAIISQNAQSTITNTYGVVNNRTSATFGELSEQQQLKQDHEYAYTPLPNFLIDEGYFAELSDKAVVILTVINRHTKGFHKAKRSMALDTIMSLSGIKDVRTARKFINELKSFGLLEVIGRTGSTSFYGLTFDKRKALKSNTQNDQPLAQYAPTPLAQHAGGTPYTTCTPLKEISLKENIKEKNKKGWLVLEKIKKQISEVNSSIDFNKIKNASWFKRELEAFEEFNADKNHSDYTMQYLFADKLIQAHLKAERVNNQIEYQKSKKQSAPVKPTSPTEKPKAKAKPVVPVIDHREQQTTVTAEKPKPAGIRLSLKQVSAFAHKLANHTPFASKHAEVGEQTKDLEQRLRMKLGSPDYAQSILKDLQAVGYVNYGLVS
ncbi:hypothetical protein [Acinetobacter sp. HY1485]|uniref:hypothetical protein n=1 Tax=Acinetobacter sp. HY1485 TaxID=2970918 RepID=UPI0022B96838|nr:hypothetical protein [Acinetobacter sp. HY1485]